jgi:CBS domain-containing protein
MFGVETSGKELGSKLVNLADLRKQYKKLVTLCSVCSQGHLKGNFHIILDQDAFFTLAGVLVVQPEKVILQNRKLGTGETATSMSDAIGEVANLMVGSFDRIFRLEVPGHFTLAKTFIGQPWANPGELGLSNETQYIAVTYESTVDKFPPFTATALFTRDIFVPPPAVEAVEATQTAPDADDKDHDIHAEPVEAAEPAAPAEVFAAAAQQSAGLEAPVEIPNTAPASEAKPPDAQPPAAAAAEPAVAPAGPVSESIRKMTSSPAILPGDTMQEYLVLAQNLRNSTVAQVMRKDIAWLGVNDTVETALSKSRQLGIEYILIGESGKVDGIVSRSDLRGALSPYLQSYLAQWRRPLDAATLNIRLKWIMSAPVHTIAPQDSLSHAARLMHNNKIRALPVVDQTGKVLGIISTAQILSLLANIA